MNKYTGKICPFCKTAFTDGDDIVICSACDMPHHKDCWVENSGCTTFGCLGGIKGVDDAPSSVTSTQMQFGAPGGMPTPQTNAGFCRTCGAPLPADSAFCPKCGSRVGNSVQMNAGYPPQQENVPFPQQRIYQSGNGVNVQQGYYPNSQQVGYQQYPPTTPQNTDPAAVDTMQLIGSNGFYYKEKFDRMRITGNKASWNWCAFLFTPFWLIYRTMYGYGAAFLGGVLLLSLINDTLCFIAALAGYFVFGIIGNYLYMQHTEKLANYLRWINEPERSTAAARKGGTNSTAVVLAAICYLIAALIIFAVKSG